LAPLLAIIVTLGLVDFLACDMKIPPNTLSKSITEE
jgi:hypothetical protein